MSEPIDPERIAALLDGRLDDASRDALLAALARSDDELDALGDAAAVLRELESAAPDGDLAAEPNRASHAPPHEAVVRELRPRRRAVPVWRWFVAAAAALVLVVAGVRTRSGATGDLADPIALVAALDDATAATPLETISWPTTRGAGDVLSDRARSIRFGAMVAQLALALRTHDTRAAGALSRRAGALIGETAGSGPAAQLFEALASDSDSSTASLASRLHEAWTAGVAFVDQRDAELGAWLVIARAACRREDAAFFRSPSSRRSIDELQHRAPDAAPATGLRAIVDGTAIDWSAVRREVQASLERLGR